jgi:hypothetical protein
LLSEALARSRRSLVVLRGRFLPLRLQPLLVRFGLLGQSVPLLHPNPDRLVAADDGARDEEQQKTDCDGQWNAMPARELPKPIPRRWRTGLHWLVVQVSLQVGGEGSGRFVAAIAVLFEGLHHDPVELAADQFAEAGGLRVAEGSDRSQGRFRLPGGT